MSWLFDIILAAYFWGAVLSKKETLSLYSVVGPFKRDFDLCYHLDVSNLLSHCILEVCKISYKIVKWI